MAQVKFNVGNRSSLPTIATLNGEVFCCVDTGEIYISKTDLTLQKYSDIIKLNAETDRTNILAPLSKFYFILETGILYYYDGIKWMTINTPNTNVASNITLDTTNFNKNFDSTITDVQKLADKVDDFAFSVAQNTYTTSSPIVQALGGIPAGKTYTNANITTVLSDLLNPYISPVISLSSTVITNILEYGTTVNSMTVTATTVKRSNNITDVQFLRNGILINDITSPHINGGNEVYTDSNILNDTTTYSAKATDGTSTTISNLLTYTFVNPTYLGSLVTDTPIESDIKGLNKIIQIKNNVTYSYTLTNSRFIIAVPKSYGMFSHVLDQNGFDLTLDFSVNTVNVNINSISVPYYVWIYDNITTQTNFSLTYKY